MQHAANAVFRAVENARPLVRASASGLTCSVDTLGRITARSPIYEESVLSVDLRLGSPRTTPYTRWGDWFPPAMAESSAALNGGSLRAKPGDRESVPCLRTMAPGWWPLTSMAAGASMRGIIWHSPPHGQGSRSPSAPSSPEHRLGERRGARRPLRGAHASSCSTARLSGRRLHACRDTTIRRRRLFESYPSLPGIGGAGPRVGQAAMSFFLRESARDGRPILPCVRSARLS
jgi:hypothetical protein